MADANSVLKIFRVACFVVAAVAGMAGTVMFVAPEDTDRYFSWPIGPPPLAALVGSFYLSSALTFAVIGRRVDWSAARGVCFGILAFTLPTLAATANHTQLFDWGRWQALAWVALFVGSPITFTSFLYQLRGRAPAGPGNELPSWTRALLGVLAVAYFMLGVGLLLTPGDVQDGSPFALPGLSGRFVGSWCLFLCVLAGFSLWRNRAHEARIPILALVIWPMAAILAALRMFDDLQPPSRRSGYLVMVAVLAALAAASLAGLPRSARRAASTAAAP